ncbi:MAG: hypothetical protein IPI66_10540 [Chitinophagaceae bacterium]|nr:hypothetical protein [Chitinophagaceae bacterium]MBL0055312.1 hypothetical protein [Chitinophagaceae bacterium]
MFKKIQAFFEKTVARVEGNNTAFSRYFYLFAAILSIRLALEFFSSRRLFTTDDVLHIGLWFIFIVLAFIIQLHLFSGEKILRVAKLAIVFFSIALTAPIIDLILTGGIGAKMNYLSLHSWKDILWSYLTIGGSSFSRGATMGIRIEIALLVLASFNYIRTKRNSIVWGLAGALCIYTVLFLSGAIPLLLGYLVSAFHLQYQHNDQSTVLLLLTLDVWLLFIAGIRYAPGTVKKWMQSISPGTVLTGILFTFTGMILALKNYPGNWDLTPTTLFWLPLFLALAVCLSAYTGIQKTIQVNPGAGHRAGNGLVLLMLLISCLMSGKIAFSLALLWALLFLLREEPLYLNRVPLLNSLMKAMVMLAASILGYVSFNAPMIGFPVKWIQGILFCGTLIGVSKEIFSGRLPERLQSYFTHPMIMRLTCAGLILLAFIPAEMLFSPGGKTYGYLWAAALPPVLLVLFGKPAIRFFNYGLLPAVIVLFIYALYT